VVVNCEIGCRVGSYQPRGLEGIKGRSQAAHPPTAWLQVNLAGILQESTISVHNAQAVRISRVVGDLMRPLIPQHVARNNQIHEPL